MFDCSESGRLHAVSDLECTRWAQLGGYDRGDFCIHDGITGRDDANDECIVLTAGVGYIWDVEQVSTAPCGTRAGPSLSPGNAPDWEGGNQSEPLFGSWS